MPTCDRVEAEEGAQRGSSRGEAKESRIRIVGKCELYKRERNVLEEEMRKIDECDMEKFGTLDSSDEKIAILWHRSEESRIRIVGQCELYKRERNVLRAGEEENRRM